MTSRTSLILSFILATLLVAGTVELFYSSFTKAISSKTLSHRKDMRYAAFSPPQKTLQPANTTIKKQNANYTIITQRNLFGSSSGSINNVPFSTDPVLDTTSLDLVLLGTIKGSADSQRAIIRNKRSAKQDIYGKGDTIEHAVIKEILRGKIILTANGKDEVLLMGEIKSPPPTTAKANTAPKNYTNQPEIYAADNDGETRETVEQPPPPVVPKRRLTLQSKKQPAEE